MDVLAFGDLHSPFHHPDALDFLRDVREEHKPKVIICLGDETDAHGWSKHEPDPGALSPGHEVEAGRAFMKQLYRLFPRCKVCRSNHGDRAAKTAKRARLPEQFVRSLREVYNAPAGWQWGDGWDVDGVHYFHGEGFSGRSGAIDAAEAYRVSCVIGHLHCFAGVTYSAGIRDVVWGMNCGCLIDQWARAFRYAKWFKHRPVLGCGVVHDRVPQFIPMGPS